LYDRIKFEIKLGFKNKVSSFRETIELFGKSIESVAYLVLIGGFSFVLGIVQILLLFTLLLRTARIKEVGFANFESILVFSSIAVYLFSALWLKEKKGGFTYPFRGEKSKTKLYREICYFGASFGFLVSVTESIAFIFHVKFVPLQKNDFLTSMLNLVYVPYCWFFGLFFVLFLLEKFEIKEESRMLILGFILVLSPLVVFIFGSLFDKVGLLLYYFLERENTKRLVGMLMIAPSYGFFNILFFPKNTPLYERGKIN
jgi:hypothetical protein